MGPIELVFGHNDLLAANLIDDGQRLWLIDWDYAGFNSPLFDLGGLASNSELPDEDRGLAARSLFRAAPRRPVCAAALRAMQRASLLRETMWSMVSELHSPSTSTIVAYTPRYLARFERAWRRSSEMERA